MNAAFRHWTAYGVEGNIEKYRMAFDANISLHDMADSYLVPMKLLVTRANVSAAMCSYSAINGTPSCANEWMNDQLLRSAWGWDGVIESDCASTSWPIWFTLQCVHEHTHTDTPALPLSLSHTRSHTSTLSHTRAHEFT